MKNSTRQSILALLLTALWAMGAQAQTPPSLPIDLGRYAPREPEYRNFDRRSLYLPMEDGTRLATDVYLPRPVHRAVDNGGTVKKLPTILYQTRYVRSLELKWAFRLLRRFVTTSIAIEEIEYFTLRGYAVVVVDSRGSGASTNHRKMEFSPDEVRDGYQVCDWIIQQPWSNGNIGTTGVSYVGTTALHLATVSHPALKCLFPRAAIFDLYGDMVAPGGVIQKPFIDIWGFTTQSMDANQWKPFGGQARLAVKGVNPVDADRRGRNARSALDSALAEHRQNFDIISGVLSIDCRDDYRPGYPINADSCSPHRFLAQSRASGIPYYWMTGWYDGAILGSAPKGFNAMHEQSRLIIGPWDHGPDDNGSPWRETSDLRFDVYGEMMRFFDFYLMGNQNGLEALPDVLYYTVGAEQWRAANEWPPAGITPKTLIFSRNGGLAEMSTMETWTDTLPMRHDVRTGASSRYNSQTTLYKYLHDTNYDSIGILLQGLPRFTTAPMDAATEITGHPTVSLNITSPTNDASVFVYLIDLAPDGRRRYITEGMFRAAHRHVSTATPPYPVQGPFHTFQRADFELLTPNTRANLAFELLPISYELKAGHRLEVVFAGCDAEHFMPIQNAPPFILLHDGSTLTLPIMPR